MRGCDEQRQLPKIKTKKDRVCTRSLRNNIELKLSGRCRYCFGGVVAGAAGLAAGFTGFTAVLPAAGAATPD